MPSILSGRFAQGPAHGARRASARLSALLCVVLTIALSGCATSDRRETHTIVLVHGAWMGASAWDRVAARLRDRRFAVVAVELPAHGRDATPAADATLDRYVATVLRAMPATGDVTLVGHSFGGIVVSAAAERAGGRVGRLVYVAAYLPADGDSAHSLSQQDKASRVGAYWTQADPQKYTPATIRADGIAEVFCAECTPADQALLRDTHREEPVPPLAAPVRLTPAAWGAVPRYYIATRRDNAVSFDLQQRMIARAGGVRETITLDSGHVPMLSRPEALAGAIADFARR